ncbi:MAG TPA: type II toxin-antitoxin system Phd/YefM family antitoxin [Thermoanaerobaculia bacterium]|nr:type II toxin-antitoxin system Phd/YefM family antitoxin [Thermoanaerobaculia bacterium]
MERVVTATEAKVRFGELMRRVVESGGTVIVEKDGNPQVAILSMAEYARLKSGQEARPDWEGLLDRAHQAIAADLGKRKLPDVGSVIQEMREERDAQLFDPGRLR